MFTEIDFSDIGASDNFKYAAGLDFFKNQHKIQFQPGLNIIFAPNGTGKSTILKMMAQMTACEQGGVSTITEAWVRDVSRGNKSHLEGIKAQHDGQAVMYANPRQAVGLIGGMAAFDDDFFTEGFAETQLKESTGMTTLARMTKILGVLNGKTPMPDKIMQKNGELNDVTKEMLKASIAKGQQTILLDEPESGLALHVQSNLWMMMERGAQTHNLQIIVATHSPFALATLANYIELQPGYLNLARGYIQGISDNIETLKRGPQVEPISKDKKTTSGTKKKV